MNKLTSAPNLNHFFSLHDKYGIMQHTNGEVPAKEHGYSIDDQTRALIVATAYQKLFGSHENLELQIPKYLEFIEKVQQKDGSYKNYISYDGEVLERDKSQDSFGRVLWSLGYYLANNPNSEYKDICEELVDMSSKYIDQITTLKARSYSLVGLSYLCQYFGESSKYYRKLIEIEKSLLQDFSQNNTPVIARREATRQSLSRSPQGKALRDDTYEGWKWFEERLTYANAIVPYALLLSYQVSKSKKSLQIGLQSLDWLEAVCRVDGKPAPIGNYGWYQRGGERAVYDQQVIDVADMVLALVEASKVAPNAERRTHNFKKSQEWLGWFSGNNTNNLMMIEPETGVVYDGLKKNGVNKNRGAESVVCYLMASLSLASIS